MRNFLHVNLLHNFSTLFYILSKKILFKVLLLDQLKKFSHRKLCKNLYNVRQVKMIELLVSC